MKAWQNSSGKHTRLPSRCHGSSPVEPPSLLGPLPVQAPILRKLLLVLCCQKFTAFFSFFALQCLWLLMQHSDLGIIFKMEMPHGTSKVAQWVRTPAAKPGDLNWIPRTYMVERTYSFELFFGLHVHTGVCPHTVLKPGLLRLC